MKHLTILCFSFNSLLVLATGAYSHDFYYKFIVCNSNGQVLKKQELEITIDDKTINIQTDSLGIINICIGSTENCPSAKNRIARTFGFFDWSWIPKLISIEYKGVRFEIKKNWKKYFRKKKHKIEFYNYETGEIKTKPFKKKDITRGLRQASTSYAQCGFRCI